MSTPFLKVENIVLVQGDSLAFEVTLLDEAGAPVDISSWELSARIGSRSNPALVTGAVTLVGDGTDGKLLIEFNPSDTSALKPNAQYSYQLRVDDTGDLVKTPLRGLITVVDSLFV